MNLTDPKLPFLGLGTEEALRGMADVLPDGFFTTDIDGRINFWNRAAERITGWTRQDVQGRTCSLFAGDLETGCQCGPGPLKCSLALHGRSSKSCVIRSADGRAIPIVKNALPLFAADGQIVGAIENFTPVPAAASAPEPGGCIDPAGDLCRIVGGHPTMRSLFRVVQLVAQSNATVMVLGESGTGKELVAEAIHRLSPRAKGPFVRVSCSALNESLLESELFGHVKGAFTGAVRNRQGRFEEANGGTLLLDEIGDISPIVQVKLLRVIQQREIERVGDSSPVPVDVRLVCATHRDLKALIAAGKFRADLYFRLNVFPIRVPTLKERIDDIPRLAAHFLARFTGRATALSAAAQEVLARYDWPGNVRELENVLEYAALQSGGETVLPEHLPAELSAPAATAPAAKPDPGKTPTEAEIRAALAAEGGRRVAAARRLGVSRVTLWKWMKKFGMASADEDGGVQG